MNSASIACSAPKEASSPARAFGVSRLAFGDRVLIRYLSLQPFMTHPYHIYLLPTVSAMTALSAFL